MSRAVRPKHVSAKVVLPSTHSQIGHRQNSDEGTASIRLLVSPHNHPQLRFERALYEGVSGPLYWLASPHSFIIASYSTASDSPNFAWSMPQTRSKLFSAGFQLYFRPVGWSLVTIVNEWPCHRFLKTRPAISSTGMK